MRVLLPRKAFLRLGALALGLVRFMGPPAHGLPPEAEGCLSCHAQGGAAVAPRLDGFDQSAHAQLSCLSCHSDATEVPHPRPPARVDCAQCHPGPAAAFAESVHGRALSRGVREVPTCADCHGVHAIRPPADASSSVWRGAVTQTCSGCHASERVASKFGIPSDRVSTFLESYHGLAGKAGDLRAANCASCHGWHDILPSSHEKSRIHPARLFETCGQCHPKAGLRLASGKVHLSLSATGGGSAAASFLRAFYLILIPLVIGGMIFHNAADFLRKALSPCPLPALRREETPLLTINERFQHGILIISFVILALSGFALKYPGSWWARLFAALGGEAARLMIHRLAALLFVVLGAGHALYLLATKRGRRRLSALWPAKRDFHDPVRLLSFNLGFSRVRPLLERFSYIEKSEYWALVWGSGVMIATGALLLFHNYALAHFPLWVIESARVVHFLEAVLACLSVLVWHFYWVIYDPEVYPMNWGWLTGRARLNEPPGKREEP